MILRGWWLTPPDKAGRVDTNRNRIDGLVASNFFLIPITIRRERQSPHRTQTSNTSPRNTHALNKEKSRHSHHQPPINYCHSFSSILTTISSLLFILYFSHSHLLLFNFLVKFIRSAQST